ncbi:NAD(+) synthase [Candidatus Falkowbacteria bacterium RIFOXYB2_FULL_47_14]|uniref:nicotinate-nucleotide adenylyltransferase n=1 Tax=Candidatus Falkowbacteria bacterium RIFOXYA2_FULL_47_19 TaxID=1797994 RepID=A0A1F5SGW2_9BACT|nr:MAG: NAD(+) synthase [Candidatus Falkowbacteria bacterium RIFOXYA2_FULL_47_19]OGF34481.1 MAG: NAD(+) synthase [Candidatus Falkowbacteria bacterium RIFOXYC2_FULL_46_15]OGF43520.1 MAG: NAD(+) synthase [Candidatus Falkowbacteria bacterium RIFOXYB2_FULL_47_14]
MKRLSGLKIALCQMPVLPGRPDLNTAYIIKEIRAAAAANADIVVFPEMCVTGYLLGDLFENEAFIREAADRNEEIRRAAKGLTAIWGNITIDRDKTGEDGRLRKYNTALIANNGEWIGRTTKTLQPKYRIFDDERHFYSRRQFYNETVWRGGHEGTEISDLMQPFTIPTRVGELSVGVILCEDMWHGDYPVNPTRMLKDNGAEIVFNLSASPWTWQKNRKRHQVVSDLLSECRVPFVYINNTGEQNTGKNLVVFDGSSAVYDSRGNIVFEIPPYSEGTKEYVFSADAPKQPIQAEDAAQLFMALAYGLKKFFNLLPPPRRRAIVGLSGGIDSAAVLLLLVYVLGKENVRAVYMPSRFSSRKSEDIAAAIARGVGLDLEKRPIEPIIAAVSAVTGTTEDSPGFENIQARARMEILAALAQDTGGMFSANWNKVEAAFGYGTLYGDMAGFAAPLGDLVKREVYQLADFMNRRIFGGEIIPEECFTRAPTAELKDGQTDPFDYGNLNRRGYHDELVRAFTEFRRDPEWVLRKYEDDSLEREFMLEPGTLARLFPTAREFVKDLERCWRMFHSSYFKRVQSVPLIITSKRAFGTDLREAMLPAYFTEEFTRLKRKILAGKGKKNRIVIYGGSFNPPGRHHRRFARYLRKYFDTVIIYPCGPRPDKPSANILPLANRLVLVKKGLSGIKGARLDFYDLENGFYTPTYLLDEKYRKKYPEAEIWHAVGSDVLLGGGHGASEVHTWHQGAEIWQNLNFFVIERPGFELAPEDMPPSSELHRIPGIYGSGTMIRERIYRGEDISGLTLKSVREYIYNFSLFGK